MEQPNGTAPLSAPETEIDCGFYKIPARAVAPLCKWEIRDRPLTKEQLEQVHDISKTKTVTTEVMILATGFFQMLWDATGDFPVVTFAYVPTTSFRADLDS